MEQTKVSPFKPALTSGAYYGVISILIAIVVWATSLMESLGLMGTMVIGIGNLIIAVVLLIIFTKGYRDNMLGGKITFGQAFVFGLLVVVFSSVITGVFSYILNKFIDPSYMERIMTAMRDNMYNMMSSRGLGEDQIDAAMRGFEEQGVPTPMKAVQQALMGGIIGGSIMSLISSAIVKKNVTDEDAFDEAMEEVKTEE